jgi:hypothetical protein
MINWEGISCGSRVIVPILLWSMMGCSANAANQPDEQMVNIGTHRLHIYCAGQGNLTVVMDTGLGCRRQIAPHSGTHRKRRACVRV